MIDYAKTSGVDLKTARAVIFKGSRLCFQGEVPALPKEKALALKSLPRHRSPATTSHHRSPQRVSSVPLSSIAAPPPYSTPFRGRHPEISFVGYAF